MKARPTEYRGVRYRSKSEATFACCLDQAGLLALYEPQKLQVDGWVPDFLIPVTCYVTGHTVGIIVEYKPSAPTDTYMKELSDRFYAIGSRLLQVFDGLRFEIVSGSVWSDHREREIQTLTSFNPTWSEPSPWRAMGIDDEHIQNALEHRYDLKHA